MGFESIPQQPAKPEEKEGGASRPEKKGLGSRLGRTLRTGLAAFSLMTAAEMAEESVAFADTTAEAAPKDRWEGKMKVTAHEEIKTDDDRVIHYFEGDLPPTQDGRKVHGVGMTITDEGDPKILGDEKRFDVSIVTEEAVGNIQGPIISVKNETPAETIRDGKLLRSPFGKAKYVVKEGGLIPEKQKDRGIAVLDKMYWALYGLKKAGKLEMQAGKDAISELDDWMAWVDADAFKEVLEAKKIKEIMKRLIEKD